MNPERVCYGCFQEKEPGVVCPECGFDENEEQPFLALPLGAVLNGRYMVGKVLGVGGFGITYLGYDLTLGIKVAIKEYMPTGLATRKSDHYTVAPTGRIKDDYKNGMERFVDEARILAKLQGLPNIVSVFNYFKENNTAYFVMEYIDGMSLKEYLASQGGKIPYEQAMTILKPIMEALAQVHATGLLHRDISPDNVYITSKGESRLLDFGAARFAMGDDKSVSVILKHGYAPEEQYSSHGNQGPWTDVYAMGATLYRCITGMLPPDSIERVHTDTLRRPSALGVKIPPNIDNAIVKALSVKAQDRFSNMDGFLQSVSGKTTQTGKTAGASAPVQTNRETNGVIRQLKENRPLLYAFIGGAAVFLLLVILLPVILLSGNKSSSKKHQTVASSSGGSGSTDTSGNQGSNNAGNNLSGIGGGGAAKNPGSSVPRIDGTETDLENMNASIIIPDDYISEGSLEFSKSNDSVYSGIYILYHWKPGVCVYSIKDVAAHKEDVAMFMLDYLQISDGDYMLTSSGEDTVGGVSAYRIDVEGEFENNPMYMQIYALDTQGVPGCYFILNTLMARDKETLNKGGDGEAIVQTFRIKGAVNANYKVYQSNTLGFKFIYNSANVTGDIREGSYKSTSYTHNCVAVFPYSDESSAGAYIEKADQYAKDVDEVISYQSAYIQSEYPGISTEKPFTADVGGVEWTSRNFVGSSISFCISAAEIDGQLYCVTIYADQTGQELMSKVWADLLASVHSL